MIAFTTHMLRTADLYAILNAATLPDDQYITATPAYAASSVLKPLTPGVTMMDLLPVDGWIRFNLMIAAKKPSSSNVKLRVQQLLSDHLASGGAATKGLIARLKAEAVADELTRTPVTRKAHSVWMRMFGDEDGVSRGPDMRDREDAYAYAGFLDGGEKQLETLGLLLAKCLTSPVSPATISAFLSTGVKPGPIELANGQPYPGLVGESTDHAVAFLTWLWSETMYGGRVVPMTGGAIQAALCSPMTFRGNPDTGPEYSTFADGQVIGTDVRACIRAGKILESAGLKLGYGGALNGQGAELAVYTSGSAVVGRVDFVPEPENQLELHEALFELWFCALPQVYERYAKERTSDPHGFATRMLTWRDEMLADDPDGN